MKKVVIVSTLLFALITIVRGYPTDDHPILWIPAIRAIDVHTYLTFKQYPVPPDTGGGIARDGDTFWRRTGDNYESFIRFDENGDVISSFLGPNDNEEISTGLTCDDDKLWINCNDTAYHVTRDGTIIPPEPFVLPSFTSDISWDGEYLWAVAGEAFDYYLVAFDVNTGEPVKSFPAGDPYFERLCFNVAASDDYVYVIVYIRFYSENWVYKYDKDGVVVDQQTFYPTSTYVFGMDYSEEPVTSIQPSSLGQIKAIYR
jgi:outer membrane protein assembly factor BamB